MLPTRTDGIKQASVPAIEAQVVLRNIIEAGKPMVMRITLPTGFTTRQAEQRLRDIAEEKKRIDPYYRMAQAYAGRVGSVSPYKPDWNRIEALNMSIRRMPNDPAATEMVRLLKGYLASLDEEEKKLNGNLQLAQHSGETREFFLPEQIQQQRYLLNSPEFRNIVDQIHRTEKIAYPDAGRKRKEWRPPHEGSLVPCFWALMDLSIHPECEEAYTRSTGGMYTSTGLPIPMFCPSVLHIEVHSDHHAKEVLTCLQLYALNVLEHRNPIEYRVFFVDCKAKSDYSLGLLRPLTGDGCVYPAPQTDVEIEQALAALQKLQSNAPKARLLVFRGEPDQLGANARNILEKLVYNAANTHLSIVFIASGLRLGGDFVPRIQYLGNGTGLYRGDPQGQEMKIQFYSMQRGDFVSLLRHQLPQEYVDSLRTACEPIPIGNAYANYVARRIPQKGAQKLREISFPFGLVDDKIQYITMSLANTTFAAYLLGSAGAGKTNTLQVFIDTLASMYHPDDLEFWLADMGTVSFSKYAKHPYPHIRYLLLDKSVEAIMSFFEKLELELDRRKSVLVKYGVKAFYELPKDCEEAAMLVAVDEFGSMSEALSDPDYPPSKDAKNRLTLLLTQGRKHGMFFIFANQNYEAGVKGMGEEAKNQIGIRLLMKVESAQEMYSCAGISHRTPEQTAEIDALEEHYLLRVSGNKMCSATLVFHIDVKSEDQARDRHADAIRTTSRFRDKHLLIFDETPCRWSDRERYIRQDIVRQRKNLNWEEGDILIYPGVPRGMDFARPLRLTNRDNQSILLLCPENQKTDTASVLQACIDSCVLQGIPVELWQAKKCHITDRLRLGLTQVFQESEELRQRISDLYNTVLIDEKDASRVIIVPDMELLTEQMKKYRKRQERLNKTQESQGASAYAMQFFSTGGVSTQDNTIETKLQELLCEGSGYNLHFIIHYGDASRCTSSSGAVVRQDWFKHRLIFHRGSGSDPEAQRYVRYLKDDHLFVHVQNGAACLYLPFDRGNAITT